MKKSLFILVVIFSLILNVQSREHLTDFGCSELEPNCFLVAGGNVWNDINQNGFYDELEETGLIGIEVNLIDDNGDVVAATMTGLDGGYIFNDIYAGQYRVLITGDNFENGLKYFASSDGQEVADNNNDNDDNGDDDLSDGVETTVFHLGCGEEPGSNDGNENFTFDFGFFFDFICEEDFPSAPSCELLETADKICNLTDLDGYCNSMNEDLVEPYPIPLCPAGGAADNMTWFSFVAGEGDYIIEVVPVNCFMDDVTGTIGVQVGVYTDCTFEESVYCSSNCSTNPVQLSSDALIPGETYYFFLDGCFGTFCDFSIEVSGDFTDYVLAEPTGLSCENDVCDQPICEGESVRFTVEGIDIVADYNWTIPVDVEVVDPLDPANLTNENNITLLFGTAGTYNICLTNVSNGCEDSQNEVCIEVQVEAASESVILANVSSGYIVAPDFNTGSATCDPTGGSGNYSYNWSNGETTKDIENLESGLYIVTIVDIADCVIGQVVDSVYIDILSFVVDEVVDITTGNLGAIYISLSIEANMVYAWSGPDGYTSSTQDLEGLEIAGCYTVSIEDTTTDFVMDSTICIQDLTAVSNHDASSGVVIYPIPTSDIISLDFQEANHELIDIRLYDVSGVKYNLESSEMINNRIQFDLSHLPSGIYFLKLNIDNMWSYHRVLIN